MGSIGKAEIITNPLSGTRGSERARIMIVGEAWGESEREKGRPFAGASGVELESMLAEAGINPVDCFYTNLINEKPSGNDMRFFLLENARGEKGIVGDGVRPNAKLTEGLRRLDEQIKLIKPSIIIACGNWPMWYLTGKGNVKTNRGYKMPTGIDTWRGSQLYLQPSPFRQLAGIPVIPIYHPAAVLRQYTWRKITVQDLRRAREYFDTNRWDDAEEGSRQNIIAPRPLRLRGIVEGWLQEPHIPIICDLETKQSRIHIVGLTRDGKTNVSIPFFHITPTGFKPVYSPLDFRDIYLSLYKLFTTPGMKFVGQNWIYDIQYITKFFHCTPRCEWDTMIAQHVMFPTLRKALDYQASMYCKHYVYWKDDLKESSDTFDTEAACRYNCEDLWRTHEIYAKQLEISAAMGNAPQIHRRMRVFPVCVEMMNEGVLINQPLRQTQRLHLFDTANQIAQWLDSVMPDNVRPQTKKGASPWYTSPTQLAEILYRRLNLRPVINHKTGAYETDKEALVDLSERYPHLSGFFSAILLLRSVRVIEGGILSAPIESDGCMRTSYNLAKAITFRLTSSENVWGGGGNLQNILRDREEMDLLEQDII